MDQDGIDQLKGQLLETLDGRIREEKGGLMAEAARKSPSLRMAVGQSLTPDGDMRLEIRLFTKRGAAANVAASAKREHGHSVRIRRLSHVKAPRSIGTSPKHLKSLRAPTRPLHVGLSIGHTDGLVGSIGGFVQTEDGNIALLSASHVIANSGDISHAETNAIHQPGPADAPNGIGSQTRVAVLDQFTELSRKTYNKADAAYAVLENGIQPARNGNIIPEGYCFPGEGKEIKSEVDPKTLPIGTRIAKIGCATGYRVGVLSAVNIERNWIQDPVKGYISIDNLVEIDWIKGNDFAGDGDSGGLYFKEDSNEAVAIHIGTGVPEDEEVILPVESDEAKRNAVQAVSFGCSVFSICRIWNLSWL